MPQVPPSIQRITLFAAWGISTLVALLAPCGYYMLSKQYLNGILKAETELRSGEISSIIKLNPALWQFEEIRLSEALDRRSEDNVSEACIITDLTGHVVAKNNVSVSAPLITNRHRIYDAGTEIALIEISRSMAPVLLKTGLVAACSSAFALLLFLILRKLPLKLISSAYQALGESERKYRLLYETMSEGLALHRINTGINGAFDSLSLIDANPAFVAMLGGDRENIFATDPLALFGDSFREHFGEILNLQELSPSISFDLHLPGKHNYFTARVFSPENGILALLLEDITERKESEEHRLLLERQLLHAQKAESLGIFASGIAHDFNNLLQAVIGYIDLAMMNIQLDANTRKQLAQALVASNRAAKLSGLLLAYTGKSFSEIKKLNLSQLLEENTAVLSAVISENIALNLQLAPDLPSINADTAQIQQVLTSIVINASEAIGNKTGTITISSGVDEYNQETLDRSRIHEKLSTGRYVWMEVRDSGCGMNDETLFKLFDPFFTTKFTGRGLGMSATQGIVTAHKGALLVESQQDVGTSIKILFPIAYDL